MNTRTDVPVTVTPEAAARVAELGIQREVEQMLAHARTAVPGVQGLGLTVTPAYDAGPPDCFLTIEATVDPYPEGVSHWELWGEWASATFPPEVTQHINLLSLPGSRDEG